MSCFCAVDDIVRCCSTSHATRSASSLRQPVLAAEAPRVRARRASSGRRRGPSRCRGRGRRGTALRLRVEVGHQAAAQRELVRELGLGEAPQVADHHQDVLVDRVDVVEVVLHLADDAPEGGQVARRGRRSGSCAAARACSAARLAEQRHEARAIRRVAAERRVDACRAAPQRAQRRARVMPFSSDAAAAAGRSRASPRAGARTGPRSRTSQQLVAHGSAR